MDALLGANGALINLPIPVLKEQDFSSDDDNVEGQCVNEISPELLQECLGEQNEVEFSNSISKLTEAENY